MKTYVKPELFTEHFELSQHVASCNFQAVLNAADYNSCTGQIPGLFGDTVVFNVGVDGCGNGIDGYCYFNAEDGVTIFAS